MYLCRCGESLLVLVVLWLSVFMYIMLSHRKWSFLCVHNFCGTEDFSVVIQGLEGHHLCTSLSKPSCSYNSLLETDIFSQYTVQR